MSQIRCPECNGRGNMGCLACKGWDSDCLICSGDGVDCSTCDGKGEISPERYRQEYGQPYALKPRPVVGYMGDIAGPGCDPSTI